MVLFAATGGVATAQEDDIVVDEDMVTYGGSNLGPGSDWDPCGDRGLYTEPSFERVAVRDDTATVVLQATEGTFSVEGIEFDQSVVGKAKVTPTETTNTTTKSGSFMTDRGSNHSYLVEHSSEFFRNFPAEEMKVVVTCTMPQEYWADELRQNDFGHYIDTSIIAASFWATILDEELATGQLLVRVLSRLGSPEVDFDMRHPEHGWLTVKVPTEVRVGGVTPVSESLTLHGWSAAAQPVSVTASVSAAPNLLEYEMTGSEVHGVLDADDPDRQTVTCSFSEIADDECMISYYNSSSISDDRAFHPMARVWWEVTTSQGTWAHATSSSEPLQVAEVQAVGTG